MSSEQTFQSAKKGELLILLAHSTTRDASISLLPFALQVSTKRIHFSLHYHVVTSDLNVAFPFPCRIPSNSFHNRGKVSPFFGTNVYPS